jgi:putative hydrolase of the HAD superfamily
VPEVKGLFWDVGGILLTNGWDREARHAAVETFHLEGEEFEDRHALVIAAFELGQLSLDGYLDRTVFYRSRAFTKDAFKAFILAQSAPYPDALSIVERLARAGRYVLATLNNESLELNLHRIERFGLRRYFTIFLSSCFLGTAKPDHTIFKLALQLTQLAPEETLFIDDRALNLECARSYGMHTIHYQGAVQLQRELRRLDVEV